LIVRTRAGQQRLHALHDQIADKIPPELEEGLGQIVVRAKKA
jgi:hypothetical protein